MAGRSTSGFNSRMEWRTLSRQSKRANVDELAMFFISESTVELLELQSEHQGIGKKKLENDLAQYPSPTWSSMARDRKWWSTSGGVLQQEWEGSEFGMDLDYKEI